MRTSLILSIAAIAALALAGCTSHPAPTAVAAALSSAVPRPLDSYHEYEARSQLAEGLWLGGIAQMDVGYYFGLAGDGVRMPTSNAQAESAAGASQPKFDAPGKYVDSVTVGPAPGVVTIVWTRGLLAGKQLVLVPVRPTAAHPSLNWKIGASTTVPANVLAHATIVGVDRGDE